MADFLLLRRSGTSFFSAVTASALAPRSYHCSPPLPVPPSNSCHCSLSYVTVHFLLVVPPLSRTHAQRFPVLTYEPANHRGNLQQPSLFVIGLFKGVSASFNFLNLSSNSLLSLLHISPTVYMCV
ncbi:hypothetical protein PIB30_088891 [Stylosanthes scabra]|uniref:Uncharacterized protein n=1 Tax=Stylosanthes scabra TaxID=79078 RepID=A0ABU6SU60_9FABA|nr:hypothetical protein [Stylosanthes scabra]